MITNALIPSHQATIIYQDKSHKLLGVAEPHTKLNLTKLFFTIKKYPKESATTLEQLHKEIKAGNLSFSGLMLFNHEHKLITNEYLRLALLCALTSKPEELAFAPDSLGIRALSYAQLLDILGLTLTQAPESLKSELNLKATPPDLKTLTCYLYYPKPVFAAFERKTSYLYSYDLTKIDQLELCAYLKGIFAQCLRMDSMDLLITPETVQASAQLYNQSTTTPTLSLDDYAQEHEAAYVTQVIEQVFGDPVAYALKQESHIKEQIKQKHILVIRNKQGQICFISALVPLSQKKLFIEYFLKTPNATTKHLVAQMMAKSVLYAKEHGYELVNLYYFSHKEHLNRVYSSIGMQHNQPENLYYIGS